MSEGRFGFGVRDDRRRRWQAQAAEARRRRSGDQPWRDTRSMTPRGRRTLLALVLLPALLMAAGSLMRAGGGTLTRLQQEGLALRRISVEGARRVAPAEIAAAAGVRAGTPLLDVDVAAVETRLAEHPWIARARAVRLPPEQLLISVAERVPLAIAVAGHGDGWLVDASGTAFARAGAADVGRLPLLRGEQALRVGEADPALAEGVALALALSRRGFRTSAEIALARQGDPDGLALRLAGTAPRIVLGSGELDGKLERLRALLAAGLPQTEAASDIDLRFADRAVLRSFPPSATAGKGAVSPGGAPPPTGRAG